MTLFLTNLILQCLVGGYKGHLSDMVTDGVVPDAINTLPKQALHVIYPNKKIANFGNELTPSQVKDTPEVRWWYKKGVYHTLFMLDLDVPTRENPTLRFVKHWLVGNIQGNNVKSGDPIAEYLGSGPPKGRGLHRYVFLVYEQLGKYWFDEPRTRNNSVAFRLSFSLKNFTELYRLGNPIAGNFFKAQWEPYVDERNKNITRE